MDYNEQKLIKRKTKYANDSNYLALAETCMLLGEWYKDREEHLRALNEYKLAAKAYEKINKPMDRGLAFRMVGEMHATLGQYKEALHNVQAYMRAAQRDANTKAMQEAHTTLGRVYLQRAESFQRQGKTSDAETDLVEADRSFRTALTICDELKRILPKTELINMQARAHLNLGITLDAQNKTDPAKENMERAIRLAKEADLFDLLYTCYNAMALSSSRWERNDCDNGEHCGQTLRLLNLSLEVASRLTSRASKMCQTLMLMATFFLKMDDFQSARQTLKRAYRLKTPVASDAKRIKQKLKVLIAMCRMEDELITTDATNYVRRKELYERMGDGACKLRNYSKAIDYYKLMLQNAEANGEADRQLIPCYVSLYQTYIDNRQYEEALEYLWKEHKIISNEPQEAHYTLMKIGKLYERLRKSFFDIQNIYLQAKDEAKKLQSIELQRVAVQRAVKVLRVYCMDLMADKMEQDALREGIDIGNGAEPDSEELLDQNQPNDLVDYDVEEEDEDEEEAERDTPNVGDEINLEIDLSDDSDADPALTIGEDLNNSSTAETSRSRKRGKRFAVRRNKKGETQLHQAAISGNKALAEQLLQIGHPVNERDFAGWLPLHEACIHGYSEIVTLLLDRGAHINDKGGTSCEGITPLHDACRNGHLDVITVLLDRGANATQRNDYGETALSMLDAWYNKLKVPLTSSETNHYKRIRNELVAQFDAAAIPTSPPLTSGRPSVNTSGEKRSLERHQSGENFEVSLSAQLASPSRSASLKALKASNSSSGYGSEVGVSLRHRNVIYDEERSTSGEESQTEDSYNGSAQKRKTAAGVAEYRSVMKAMRKQHFDNEQSPTRATSQKRRQTARFVDEQEEKDDWLIDDMKQTTKKSRMNRESREFVLARSKSFSTSTNPVESVDDRDSRTTRYCSLFDSDGEDLVEEQVDPPAHDQAKRSQQNDDKQSAFNVIMNNSAKSFRRTQTRRNSNESRSSSFGRRSSIHQSSLLDAGFQRVASPTLEEKENFIPQECSPGSPIKQSVESFIPQPPLQQERVVKVVLDNGETYTVPCNEQLKSSPQPIEWLSQAVIKQYIMNHGKRPLMNLKTADGSWLNSDTIHELLQTGSAVATTVHGQIYGMEHIELERFYDDYCKEHNLAHDNSLRRRLIMMERNEIIILENDFACAISSIAKEHVLPMVLLVTFFQQDWLKHLDLSMNSLTDDDIATLARYLPVCRQLRILRLTRNILTSRSVEMLCFGCPNASDMTTDEVTNNPAALGGGMLVELDLSHNPLEDDALVPLGRLCSNLPFLRILRIRSVDVTHFSPAIFPSSMLNHLETFDISENKLTERSAQYLLQQLAESKLREAYLTSLPVCCINFKPKLWQTLSQNRMDELRTLNLTNCRLTDEEMESTLLPAIVRNCAALARLDLSRNVSLTQRTFLAVLRHCAGAVFELEEVNFHHDVQLWIGMETFHDSTNHLLELIEYSPTARYPKQIQAILPVCSGYNGEMREMVLTVIEQFWRSLRPSNQSHVRRHENELQVTLSVEPTS